VILETLVVEVCDKMSFFSVVTGQNERGNELLRMLCVISMEYVHNFAAKLFYSLFKFRSLYEEIVLQQYILTPTRTQYI
jgi:hypothetical protein